jgi:AraC-like DNA-binding protein
MDLYLSLIRIGAALMLTFVTFSLSYRINKNANSYLAILFGVLTILLISSDVRENLSEKWLWLEDLNIIENTTSLIPALLYISVYHFVQRPNNFLKEHFLLFLPFLITTTFWLYLNFLEINFVKLKYFIEILDSIFLIGTWFFSLIVFYLVVKMLVQHKNNILIFHSNTQDVDLNWLYKLMLVFPILFIVQIIFNINSNQYYLINISDIAVFLILFYSGFHIAQQREIFDVSNQQKVDIENQITENIVVKKEELIDNNLVLEIANSLENLMKEKKPFLNKNLSLPKLADKLNIRTHILSFVLNTHYNVNFYNYINSFRIDYCKALLTNSEKQHITMEGLALEGGFGSKSTFNTLFKKQTGTTPTQYKNIEKQKVMIS